MAMQNPGQMYIPEPEVAVVHRETADGQAISACTVRSHLHMRPISLVSSADDLRSAAVEEEPSEDSARLQKLNGKVKNSQPERVKETLEERFVFYLSHEILPTICITVPVRRCSICSKRSH